MRTLSQRNLPNVAFWAVTLWMFGALFVATLEVMIAYAAGMVQPETASPDPALVVASAGVLIMAHFVIIKAAPSLLRWAWFLVVTVAVVAATFQIFTMPPQPQTYDLTDMAVTGAFCLIICLPLLRFRLVDPAKKRRRL